MIDRLRLTALSGQGGCSAKIGQADLAEVFAGLISPSGGDLLVSADGMDDAAVYRLTSDLALVATTDFFPPPVDDPADYGAIATANALSDVYAMGASPLLLLNLVGFDLAVLGPAILRQILEGGRAVAQEAGCAIAGGHSIRSQEPLFGCAVLGRVDPARLVTNSGARPGDRILLTKPLGTGVILNAHKQGVAPAPVLATAVATMRRLNRAAAESMVAAGASAATDVTGFGLLGHAHNLAVASGIRLQLRSEDLPLLPGARDLAAAGHLPGGSRRNLELARSRAAISERIELELLQLACDAQTSGGLLIAVNPAGAARIRSSADGVAEIGEVLPPVPGAPPVELI